MKSKYFKPYELVSEQDYKLLGDDKVFEIFDANLLSYIDIIKEKFPHGTMTINNWYWGGDRQFSGLRTPTSQHYNIKSMHSWGKAIDAVFSQYEAEEVRQYIISNQRLFPKIKGIETDINWLHIDTRNRNDLLLFQP